MVGIMLGGPGDGSKAPPQRGGHGGGAAGGRSGRHGSRAVAMEVKNQAAEAKRLAALEVLDGLGQGKVSFEDVWHTTEFQKRMLDLCRSLYGDADAQYRFNLLNDVRNDLTADGKKALEKLFENYSGLGGDRGRLGGMGDRSYTMDFCELKACLVDLGCFPSAKNKDWVLPKGQCMLTKQVMTSIFAAVNANMDGLDDDAHEFSFEEFYVAMCMVSVYCNKPMDAIVFPNSMKTENLEDLNKKIKPDAKESSASQMAALVKPEHMRIIQEMFEECHGEMTVEQFIDSLGFFMGMAPQEAETMFLKIDYNGDGGITWSEFSNYILALGEKSTSADDRVLVSLINPRMSLEYLHKDAISAAAIVPANRWRPGADKYVTFSKDGPINIWGGAQGNPLKQDTPFSLKGGAAYVFSACAMVMYNVVLVSSNDQKIRFYSFEPRFKQDLEYDCEDCVAHSTHCFAARLGPEQSWVSWFVWGDNLGRVHVVPETTITEYRVQSTTQNIAQVKTSAVKLQHTSGLKWRNVGTTRPATGRQIHNSNLAEAILAVKNLKEREWESFGISQLGIDDYILAGENYFQPAECADKAYTRSLFTGFVTAIQYVADAGPHGLLVMCSNDANVVMFDPDTRSITRRFQGHSLAVKCLTWVRNYRSIASSGLDRVILLWDPTTGHRTGRYSGHKAAVVSMCYFDRTEVLFSLDLRYQLFVWDTSKQMLLTQINTDAGDPFVTKHRQRSQLMLLNEHRGHLAICGKRPYIWKIREEEKKADGAVMHDAAILAVIYNDLFSQIITVDYSGLVGIWEIHTGQQCTSFRITEKFPDGSQVSITAAILDPIKRCVALGLANGKIVTHNCQNGIAVNEFLTAEVCEQRSTHPITSLHFSESGEDGCETNAANAQLFATGHQLTGVCARVRAGVRACVYGCVVLSQVQAP
jgi:WD40 repeat protein